MKAGIRLPAYLGSVGCLMGAFSFALLLALAGCQTVDPPEAQTFLHVQLNDSLARYERVLVQIYDRDHTDSLLHTLWDAPLRAPKTDIPGYDMKSLGTTRFIIKVSGFKAGGQLALQTRIFYEPPPGRPTVVHDSVPPLVPQNWLESMVPSVGKLTPDFNRDSLDYQLKMPEKTSAVAFTLTAPFPGVIIQADGQQVASGATAKAIQIGNSPDTAWMRVTDTSTGVSATREYRVIIFPTLPPGVSLASLQPSTGRLNRDFTSDNTVYILYMPPGADTVSFLATPADPRTMTVTIDNQAVFPGQESQVITVAKGSTYTVPIYVRRGTDAGYYEIKLDHTQTSSH
jgi:hypothetical protein